MIRVLLLLGGLALTTNAYTCIDRYCQSNGYCQTTPAYCNGTSYGCMVSRRHTSNNVLTRIHQSCATFNCINQYTVQPAHNDTTESDFLAIDCCNWENCNTEQFTTNVDEPGVKQCYTISCDTPGCIERVVQGRKARMCVTDRGCYFGSNDVTQGRNWYAGCSLERYEVCHSSAILFANGTYFNSHCCDENLCNNGIHTIPDTPACFAVHCQGQECMKMALKKGVVNYCKQVPGSPGCMTVLYHDYHGLGYVEVRSCSDQGETCKPSRNETHTVICCHGNLCNDGDERFHSLGTCLHMSSIPTLIYATCLLLYIVL